MTFDEKVKLIGNKILQYEENDSLKTEEATKMAIISPFIKEVLGFNVFDPNEVVPEMNADLYKTREKVDYSIIIDEKPVILIEAKGINDSLDKLSLAQLSRYFHVTESRIGALTNGRIWQFYSDINKTNILDDSPFLTIDITSVSPVDLRLLEFMSKDSLNIDALLEYAINERHTQNTIKEITNELKNPSDEFARMIYRRVFPDGPSRLNSSRIEGFIPIMNKAIASILESEGKVSLLNNLGKHELNKNNDHVNEDNERKVYKRKFAEVVDPKGNILLENKSLNATVVKWFTLLAEHPVWGVKLRSVVNQGQIKFITFDREKVIDPDTQEIKGHWTEIAPNLWTYNTRSAERCFSDFEIMNEALGTNVTLKYIDEEDDEL